MTRPIERSLRGRRNCHLNARSTLAQHTRAKIARRAELTRAGRSRKGDSSQKRKRDQRRKKAHGGEKEERMCTDLRRRETLSTLSFSRHPRWSALARKRKLSAYVCEMIALSPSEERKSVTILPADVVGRSPLRPPRNPRINCPSR